MPDEPESVGATTGGTPAAPRRRSQPPVAGDDLSFERIITVGQGYAGSKCLFIAVDIGLFEALGAGRATVEELAARCGVPARAVRVLADALELWGLLERDGDGFRSAPDVAAFLSGAGPVDLRPMLRHFDRVSYPSWQNAAESFRTGRGVRGPLTKDEAELYEASVAFMTAPGAAALVDAYDFGAHRRLLDAGGGVGGFLTAILSKHPEVTGTLLELPDVAEIARGRLAGDPAASRIEVLGADLFTDPLPSGHDAVLLADVLHLFAPDANHDLLRRLREVTPDGGRLLIVEWYTGPDPHPFTTVLSAEWLTMSGGSAYTADEVTGWLAATGWRFVEHRPVMPPATLTVAETA